MTKEATLFATQGGSQPPKPAAGMERDLRPSIATDGTQRAETSRADHGGFNQSTQHSPAGSATAEMIDNEAMYKLCSKEGSTARTRYFIRATTFVKDAAQKCIIKLFLVPTDLEIADLFTKALDQKTFEKMRDYLFNHSASFKTKEMGLKAEKMVMKLNSILSMFDKVRVTGDSPH